MIQKAGKRNQVIQLQRIVRAVDANGQRSESWYTYATVFGEKIDGASADTERAGTFGNIAGGGWNIPYYPSVSVLDRINYNGRIFDIKGIDDPGERHMELNISCTEHT